MTEAAMSEREARMGGERELAKMLVASMAAEPDRWRIAHDEPHPGRAGVTVTRDDGVSVRYVVGLYSRAIAARVGESGVTVEGGPGRRIAKAVMRLLERERRGRVLDVLAKLSPAPAQEETR